MNELASPYVSSEQTYGKALSGVATDGGRKMNESFITASGAYASEEEWAMEINDTLGLGTWFDAAGAAVREHDGAAAPVAAEVRSTAPKASIHHGPSSSRRIKKKKGMPKRPLSAYNLFFQKERVRIYEQSSGRVTFEDLGKTIGQRWKSLSEEDRREYDELAEAEVARYRQERDVYDEMRRKTLGCKDSMDELDDAATSTGASTSWLADDSVPTRSSSTKETSSKTSLSKAPYYFKPHDPDAPPPYTSLPPGMLVSLRDPDGREQSYKIEYKCFRMTRKDAEEYMDRLNEQMETGQVK